jgi:hypothetical protein
MFSMKSTTDQFKRPQAAGPVYDGDDRKRLWMLINKTGPLNGYSGSLTWKLGAAQEAQPCRVHLENFVRGGNPANKDQGEVLWAATFNPLQLEGDELYIERGQEPADEVYFNGSKHAMVRSKPDPDKGHPRRVRKWALRATVAVEPGTRGNGVAAGFTLSVIARGTSICSYDTPIQNRNRHHDPHGGCFANKWELATDSFVDTLAFQLVQVDSGEVVAAWDIPGDAPVPGTSPATRSPPPPAADLALRNALFSMQMRGGWASPSPKPLLTTAPGWDPCLALLVAELVAYELSPGAIKAALWSVDRRGWQSETDQIQFHQSFDG